MTPRVPTTCREAAALLRARSARNPHLEPDMRFLVRAEVLEAFGDAPVPASLLASYNFDVDDDDP